MIDLSSTKIAWAAQPGPQSLLMQCPATEILYGGARGGGKTDGAIGHFAAHASAHGKAARGIFFRNKNKQLENVFERTKEIYPKLGWNYTGSTNSGNIIWYAPNGATLKMRYLEKDRDADNYQGHQYTWICFEEAGNWDTSQCIRKLRACLRTAVPNVKKTMLLTANPGGVGHNWLKRYYIDPAPPLSLHTDPETNMVRCFIPSKVTDNPALLKADPNYVNQLKGSGPEWLVKAWLDGNWDIIAGGMFDDVWDASKHILKPFEIPRGWTITRSFDWGSSKPFSVGWWAELDGNSFRVRDKIRAYPKGTKIRIAEWYGCQPGRENEGLRMTAQEIAQGMREREEALGIYVEPGPADSSIYTQENGPSIADDMEAEGIYFLPADKRPGSRVSGWEQMRKRFKASLQSPMEEPGLFVFETCRSFIRTVPTLPRDERNLDDINTNAEDHIADETRYQIMWSAGSSYQFEIGVG